jgi:hypothetical protein
MCSLHRQVVHFPVVHINGTGTFAVTNAINRFSPGLTQIRLLPWSLATVTWMRSTAFSPFPPQTDIRQIFSQVELKR